MKGTPVTTKEGRVVGILRGSVLYKNVQGKRHLFRKIGNNGSWGIDYDILYGQLPERGSVYITDAETNTIYMAQNGTWKEHGVILHFKEGERDHNTQVFLPLEYFSKTKNGP